MKKILLISIVVALIVALALFAFVFKNLNRQSKKEPVLAQAAVVKPEVKPPAPAPVKDSFDGLFKSAVALEAQGELQKARDAYKNIITNFTARSGIDEVQKKLEGVNTKILFSAVNVGDETATYVVKEGDSLFVIANQFHTTTEFIKKQNGLSSDIIRIGLRLRVWTGRFSVLVDKSQNILTLSSNGEVLKTYRVSTGKNNITPVGTFKIINKLVNPPWTHDGKVVPYGSPENILGTRWMGFDVPGYGIHGTTQPETIGSQATAGCVRMHNNEVEELFSLLPANTEVIIID